MCSPSTNPAASPANLNIVGVKQWGEAEMVFVITTLCAAIVVFVLAARHRKDRQELDRHTITAAALHELLGSNQDVLIIDVRQSLDLLADSVIIPGAQWFSPELVRANPSLLPRERDLVVYCTCPSDKTSRMILRRALDLGFSRAKFLKGGLDGWRTSGFPVEPYRKPFQLSSD